LTHLATQGLLRTRPAPFAPDALSFCSNDYLGLASLPIDGAPAGAAASRLVSGERVEHVDLERDVADWLGTDDALLFTSGYAANLGTVSALAQPGDLIVSDALNHASLIDGARLSRAQIQVVPHLDPDATAAALRAPRTGRAWVLTESYFSMDGDSPPLAALRAVCDEHGAALVVDEAHALGVLGPYGKGLCAAAGIKPDVLVGTFGKAFGAGGAFVAGCRPLILWLWNRARSFVFSTGISPAVAHAARAGFHIATQDSSRREAVLRAADRFRTGLKALGLEPLGHGPIIPWVIGDPQRTVALATALRDRGLHVQPIRPPTVPAGSSRLRLTVTARHTDHDVDRALDILRGVLQDLHA
jgi:8-amino-7-oxononanoate synthase